MKRRTSENGRFTRLLMIVPVLFMISCGEKDEPIPTDPAAKKIYERKNHFKSIGKAFKFIDDEIKSKNPDFVEIQKRAQKIYSVGQNLPDWFSPETGPDSGFETDSLIEIWQDTEKFKSAHHEFLVETERLIGSSKLANKSVVSTQFHTTGVTCSNCHKSFRVEED